jgi:hypothetical protein
VGRQDDIVPPWRLRRACGRYTPTLQRLQADTYREIDDALDNLNEYASGAQDVFTRRRTDSHDTVSWITRCTQRSMPTARWKQHSSGLVRNAHGELSRGTLEAPQEGLIMPVTDDQVSALRALLQDDTKRYGETFDQLDRTAAKKGYTALVAGAFMEAVQRRFGQNYRESEVVDFVASLRTRSNRLADRIDPDIAERMIKSLYGDATVRDVSDGVVAGTQLLLLTGLVADAGMDDAQLEPFLSTAGGTATS